MVCTAIIPAVSVRNLLVPKLTALYWFFKAISISAGASISGQIDHIDLDSHYNLDPDPASGATMINGVTMPRIAHGHGAFLKNEPLC